MRCGGVFPALEAGENEDAALGEAGKGNPAGAVGSPCSVQEAVGGHGRWPRGAAGAERRPPWLLGSVRRLVQGILAQAFLKRVVLTPQPAARQMFDEHWLSVRFGAACWGHSGSRAEARASQSSLSGARKTDGRLVGHRQCGPWCDVRRPEEAPYSVCRFGEALLSYLT